MGAHVVRHRRARPLPLKPAGWYLCGAILATLLAQAASAQSSISDEQVHLIAPSRPIRQAQREPTLKAKAELVLVNAVATDSEGRLVSTLKASDFSIVDGKGPQPIRYFSANRPKSEKLRVYAKKGYYSPAGR